MAALRRLGFALVSKDAGNKMFITLVLRKDEGGKDEGGGGGKDKGGGGKDAAAAAAAKAIAWPELRACVYKKR